MMPAQLWKSHSGRTFCFLIQISVHQAQYRCKDCSGCELRSKCFKSSDEVKNKEIRMCVESTEHRKTSFENLLSERKALLRMNRSIQVEGAFGVLKNDRSFLMRGKTNISTELFLLCLAFDLQKFFSKLQRG